MNRLLLVLLVSIVFAATGAARLAEASDQPGAAPAPAIQQQEESIDDNDDTRVEVQLTVLAVILCVVVGLGIPLFFLRKKLGLVPDPPGEDAAGVHH